MELHQNPCPLHQGSLLSPFLFSIYIDDLPNHLSSSTGVGLFADDTKLYKAVIRRRYTKPSNLVRKKRLCFEQTKCKVLSITRRSTLLFASCKQVTLSNTDIDLGVFLNSKLTWISQVNV